MQATGFFCTSRTKGLRLKLFVWQFSISGFGEPPVAFMVYPKDVDINIVIVVNTDTFLWISVQFGLESGVYEQHKPTRKPCMSEELFWDKKTCPQNAVVYSHLAPVDIHMLIHRRKHGELMTLVSVFPHPIIQGPTARGNHTSAQVAAVSHAGALGCAPAGKSLHACIGC
jgi:hypothetical protein